MIVLVVFSTDLFIDQPDALLPNCAFFRNMVSLWVPLPDVMESPEATATVPDTWGGGKWGGRPHFLGVFWAGSADRKQGLRNVAIPPEWGVEILWKSLEAQGYSSLAGSPCDRASCSCDSWVKFLADFLLFHLFRGQSLKRCPTLWQCLHLKGTPS